MMAPHKEKYKLEQQPFVLCLVTVKMSKCQCYCRLFSSSSLPSLLSSQ